MDSVPVMNGSTRPLDGEDGAEGQSQPNVVQERGKEDARDEGVDRELDATHSVQEEPVEHNKQTLDHTSENSTFANGNLDVAVNARGDSAENQSHVSERPSLDDRHHSHLALACWTDGRAGSDREEWEEEEKI
ncbi:hypothetical protein MD484_g8638, partial [Candolleomyces efflorescens]